MRDSGRSFGRSFLVSQFVGLCEEAAGCAITATIKLLSGCLMNSSDVAKAIDIHRFLDRLEEGNTIQNYYRINHLTPQQRERLALRMAESLVVELESMGLHVDC